MRRSGTRCLACGNAAITRPSRLAPTPDPPTPMSDGDERESYLTADYNAEMVDHIAEHPEVRDMGFSCR
jgi:hypothetical protein